MPSSLSVPNFCCRMKSTFLYSLCLCKHSWGRKPTEQKQFLEYSLASSGQAIFKKTRAIKIEVADIVGWQILVNMVDDRIWKIWQKLHRKNFKIYLHCHTYLWIGHKHTNRRYCFQGILLPSNFSLKKVLNKFFQIHFPNIDFLLVLKHIVNANKSSPLFSRISQ